MWDCNVAYRDIDAYDLFYFGCPQGEPHTCLPSKEDENSLLAVQPSPKLPDCIPREIKSMCAFVYVLLLAWSMINNS